VDRKIMIIFAIALSVVVGTAYATNSFPSEGNVNLEGDGSSGIQLKIKNYNNKQNSITFQNLENGLVYKFRLIGDNFQLIDTSSGRIDMHIENATGNIAIGHDNPKEKLDVDGNLRLRGGQITNPGGDICIGACP
jgi:hypothetical protein